MKALRVGLLTASMVLAACSPGDVPAALCERVEAVAGAHDAASRALADAPEPAEVGEHYRRLSARYEHVAGALRGRDAVESVRELASMFARSAELAETHEGASSEELERQFEESDTVASLRERMAGPYPMGFSEQAWTEIDSECDVAVDRVVGD